MANTVLGAQIENEITRFDRIAQCSSNDFAIQSKPTWDFILPGQSCALGLILRALRLGRERSRRYPGPMSVAPSPVRIGR